MNIEDIIHERHAFEDQLRLFLALAASMTDRELEIALARLADAMKKEKNHETTALIRLKGETLKTYYDLRVGKQKKQSTMLRMKERALAGGYIGSGIGEVLVAKIAATELGKRIPIRDGAADSETPYSQLINRLAP